MKHLPHLVALRGSFGESDVVGCFRKSTRLSRSSSAKITPHTKTTSPSRCQLDSGALVGDGFAAPVPVNLAASNRL